MKKNLLILSIVAISFFSCSKSDSNPSNPGCQLSTASVAGTYKITTLRYKAPGFPEIDGFTLMEDCQKDDVYVLNSNGSLNYNDVGTVCTPTSGSRVSTWSLSGSTLTIESRAFTVTNFTCTSITGTKADASTPGDLLTATFTRQ